MTRICFLRIGATPLFLPNGQGEFGGAEVRAWTFAKALVSRGVELDFAVAPHADLPSVTPEGIRVVQLPPRSRGIKKLVRSLRGRWNSVPQSFPSIQQIEAKRIACFGVHSPTPQVIAAAKATGKNTILFLTSSEDVGSNPEDNTKARRQRIQHNYAIQHADEVVVQTETQLRDLEQRFRRSGTVIRNPIDTRIHDDELLQFRSHVLWVGRADQDSKRADLCFELAKSCPDIPFHVVMNGGDQTLLRKLLESKPANVQVDTYVPLDEIERLYRTATVLINTSVSEGFPNAFLQAMKYRTPILSLQVDPDEVITRYNCGDVAGSMPRMVEHLANYWPRGPLSVKKGKRARAYVTQHHELCSCVDQLLSLINGMADRATAAA